MKRHASCAIDNDANKTEAAAPITTNETLNAITKDFKRASFLAVDTEFIRERTYYPQLCLIQISDGVTAAAIDPLANGLVDYLLDLSKEIDTLPAKALLN